MVKTDYLQERVFWDNVMEFLVNIDNYDIFCRFEL